MPLAIFRSDISITGSPSPNHRTDSTIEKAHLVYLGVYPKMNLISMSKRQISVTEIDLFSFVVYRFCAQSNTEDSDSRGFKVQSTFQNCLRQLPR